MCMWYFLLELFLAPLSVASQHLKTSYEMFLVSLVLLEFDGTLDMLYMLSLVWPPAEIGMCLTIRQPNPSGFVKKVGLDAQVILAHPVRRPYDISNPRIF